MDQQAVLYLLPYITSIGISLGAAYICWQRRAIPGAGAYSLVALLQGVSTVGYVLELLNPTLEGKIVWDSAQWFPLLLGAAAFLAFAIQYTGHQARYPQPLMAALAIVAGGITLLAFTDEAHHLMRLDAQLERGVPFDALRYGFTPMVYLAGVYSYVLLLTGLGILAVRFFRSKGLYRQQIAIILAGILISVVGIVLVYAGVRLSFHRDTTPFTFALGNLIVAIGLVRLRLFDIAPVAHDVLFDSLPDYVYVVDRQNRLVDANPAAQETLNMPYAAAIGRPLAEIFPHRLVIVERFSGIDAITTELEIPVPNGVLTYDLRISPVLNRSGQLRGKVIAARDITERKRAQEEARLRGEERFRDFIASMPILLDAFDAEGNIIVWNKTCEEVTGYSAQEMLLNPRAMEILYPDPAYRAHVWEASTNPENKGNIFELKAKDGEIKTILWVDTYHTLDIPGWAYWGMGLDITERKRAEEAEIEQRAFAEAMVDTAAALNSILDLDMVLDNVLSNLGRAVKYDAANIMLIDGDEARIVRASGYPKSAEGESANSHPYAFRDFPLMRRLVERSEPIMIGDTQQQPEWVVRPDTRWIRSMMGVPISLKGEVIGIINMEGAAPGFFRAADVKRLQAFADQVATAIHNARLYEAERHERILAQTLQKTAAALIRTVETQDSLALIVDQLAEVVPYDQALLLTVEADSLQAVAARGLPDADLKQLVYQVTKDSPLYMMLTSVEPVMFSDVQQHPNAHQLPGVLPTTRAWMAIPLITWGVVIGMLIVGRSEAGQFDARTLEAAVAFGQQAAIALENTRMMEEMSQMVFKLREAQARLARAARLAAAGEIAAGVAHQINNPLTAIIAEASLLLSDLKPDDPGYESAQAIREAAHLAGNIVQRQLNLSRAIPYELEPIQINDSLRSTAALVRIQIEPLARLILALEDDLPPISGSAEHLADVWLNLMMNAKDAVSGKAGAEIVVSTQRLVDENAILIRIQDNGQGISQAHLERIFDPFFTTKARGHGLGLPIVYETVRRHHGDITVDSREGIGTTMQITLPISAPSRAQKQGELANGPHFDRRR